MKKINMLLAAVVCCCAAVAADLYDDMASTPELLKKWYGVNQNVKLLPNGGPEGKYAVEISADKPVTSRTLTFNLPIDRIKGKKVEFSADVKAENVVRSLDRGFLGIKFMLYFKRANGKVHYFEGPSVGKKRIGTFNWTEFESKCPIPADVVSARLEIGLQHASGKVLFSDIDIEIED